MATPLGDLLDRMLNDPEVRAGFEQAPETFMHSHGYDQLDADDVQEALFVMADGSPPVEADALLHSGRAIDHLDASARLGIAGAVAGLGSALRSLFGADAFDALDPAALDGMAGEDASSDHADDDDDNDNDDDDQDHHDNDHDKDDHDKNDHDKNDHETLVDDSDLAADDVSSPDPHPSVPDEFDELDDGWGDVIT